MSTWFEALRSLISTVPMMALLLLFIRSWSTRLRRDIDDKQPKGEFEIYIKNFEEDLKEMNGEVKRSFDKLVTKIEEQTKFNTEYVKELARLTQRVDDLVRNENKVTGE